MKILQLSQLWKDIFGKYILSMVLFIIIVKWSNNIFIDSIFFLLLCIISILYISSHFKQNNLDRIKNYSKLVLFIRELISVFGFIVLLVGISKIAKFSQVPDEIIGLFQTIYLYLIAYRLLFAIMAIALGLKLFQMFLVLVAIIPIVVFIGVFDVKWWAAVTGAVVIWNYINSKDFVIFLRKGRKIKSVSDKLEYVWQRNKFFVNIGTVIFYTSLIVSSFFEENSMSFIDRAYPRLYSLMGVVLVCTLIYLFLFIYFIIFYESTTTGKFERGILWIGGKLKLNKLDKFIDMYRIAVRKK